MFKAFKTLLFKKSYVNKVSIDSIDTISMNNNFITYCRKLFFQSCILGLVK